MKKERGEGKTDGGRMWLCGRPSTRMRTHALRAERKLREVRWRGRRGDGGDGGGET